MEGIVQVPPQYQESFKAHSLIEQEARRLAAAIHDDVSYREACNYRITIKNNLKKWLEGIHPLVKATDVAHKEAKAVENMGAEPLENSLEILDAPISSWRRAAEAKRQLDQEKINRQLKKEEEDRMLAEAEELKKSGKHAEAEAVLDAPIVAPEVVLPTTTKVAGISDRTYWSADVFDIVLLCKAVVEGRADKSCVMANEKLFNGMARSMKTAMNAEWEPKGVRAISRADIA